MKRNKAKHRLAVLALPGVISLELGIANEVFRSDPNYELVVCAQHQSLRVAGSGFRVVVANTLSAVADADTVVVPGYEDIDVPVSAQVVNCLKAAHADGARVVSICSGAFALAAAGLLDGRPATTHWRVADELARRYPLVKVEPNLLFVDDGDVLTSAGVTAGVDLCLHLIRRDHGAAAANTRARMLVAPPQRPGGQAQYVERLLPPERGDRLSELRSWMLDHLSEPMNIDILAERALLSRRTLVRWFREETGSSPMAWLTEARIDRARVILETTDEPVEHLGRLTGLGAAASVRAAFHRCLDTSPQEYRSLFR
jgi:transcriptional regulator GlxA family with amidase domain